MVRTTRASQRAQEQPVPQEQVPPRLRDHNPQPQPAMAQQDGNVPPQVPPVVGNPPDQQDQAAVDAAAAAAAAAVGDPNDAGNGAQPLLLSQQLWDQTQADIQQLRRLLGPQHQQRIVAESKVPQFEGFKDPRPAEIWIAKLDSLAAQNNWDDQKYVEAACNAMTKEAENWVQNIRFSVQYTGSQVLATKDNFRKAFLDFFDVNRSVAEQSMSLTQLKQGSDERVKAFWIRVEAACKDFMLDFLQESKFDIRNPSAPGAGDGSDDYYRYDGIIMFMNLKLRDMHFINGLKPNIGNSIRPRLKELKQLNVSVLQAAQEIETAQSKTSPQSISSVSEASSAELAAYKRWQQQQQPRQQPQQGSSNPHQRGKRGGRKSFNSNGKKPSNQLKEIQGRTTSVFCTRCKQWGRHWAQECRRPQAEIQSLTWMDRNAAPAVCADEFFDGLDAMPEEPSKQGN